MQTLKVKVVNPAIKTEIPAYATPGSAGLDLVATSMKKVDNTYIEYGTNLAFEIPAGHVGLIFPRSSVTKMNMTLKNSVGVIDADYRGEVTFRFQPATGVLLGMVAEIGDALEDHLVGVKSRAATMESMEEGFAKVMAAHAIYQVGDKIGQLVVVPLPRFRVELVGELSDTERGAGGYGSTGQ